MCGSYTGQSPFPSGCVGMITSCRSSRDLQYSRIHTPSLLVLHPRHDVLQTRHDVLQINFLQSNWLSLRGIRRNPALFLRPSSRYLRCTRGFLRVRYRLASALGRPPSHAASSRPFACWSDRACAWLYRLPHMATPRPREGARNFSCGE